MQSPSLSNVLYNAFQHHTANLYTCLPCIVLTVYNDLADQRVDVQPCINRATREGDSTEHAPILNVPVIFPASSTSAFTFPIAKGDNVLCVFSQRTTDLFRSGNGYPSDPNDFRRFDRRDAIAIPGLFPFQKAINNPKKRTYSHNTQDAVIAHNIGSSNEVELRLKPNGDCIINSPRKVIVNATNNVEVNTQAKAIVTAVGNVEVTTQASATVTASTSATVTAPIMSCSCSTSFTITSPTMTFNGNMIVNGNFTMSSGGFTSTFNGNISTTGTIQNNGKNIGSTHTHSGVTTGVGSTGAPN